MRDLALPNISFLELNWGTFSSAPYDFPSIFTRLVVSNHPGVDNTDLAHYHEEAHLTFLLNGGAIDKRKHGENERRAGEIMFFNAGEVHQTINRAFPTKYITITFADEFMRRHGLTEADLNNTIALRPGSKFAMLKMYRELEITDEFLGPSIEMLVLNLICKKGKLKAARPEWIDKVHDLLYDEWNRELTLEDLSRVANVHPKTISRYFPKYFACTLGEYRRQIKIERSLPLIKASDLSLTEIAHECNFSDQSHFIRTFKEFVGILPKVYRKMN